MNKAYKIKIGKNMRQWRALRGMKQREVAIRLGVSEAAVSHFENDIATPNLKHLEDISVILGISVVMLLEGPRKFIKEADINL